MPAARSAVLPVLLILLLHCSTHARADSSSAHPQLFHLPIDRSPVPASRLYAFHRRPWYNRLPSPPPINSSVPHNPDIFSNPLHGSLTPLGEYYVTLTFGGQPVRVQVDTGSSTMAVPLLECSNCRKGDQRFDISRAVGPASFIPCSSNQCRPNTCYANCGSCSPSRACCSRHHPSGCSFYLRYADKSGVNGALVRADVGISSLVTSVVFGAIMEETSSFESKEVDGIFGLAYKTLACNPTCVTPLFDVLVETGKVKHDIFSICTGLKGGVLTLGGSNPILFEGNLSYVPLATQSRELFYLVDVKSTSIGGKEVDLPFLKNAIIDSGTTLLIVSKTTYAALRDYFTTHYCHVRGLCTSKSREVIRNPYYPYHDDDSALNSSHGNATLARQQVDGDAWGVDTERASQSWFAPGYCVNLSAKELRELPTITIQLDGFAMDIEPEVYMLEHTITRGMASHLYRCLGISALAGMESMPNDAIVGDTVLHKYFVEYDRENRRLGFAVAKTCFDPSAVEPPGTKVQVPRSLLERLPQWIRNLGSLVLLLGAIAITLTCINRRRRRGEGYASIAEPESY